VKVQQNKISYHFRTNGVTGSIEINGRQRNVQKFRKQSSYITQEFAILELLTTRETMVVAADLKLDSDVGKEMKNGMVSIVFVILKLQGVLHW
jgi:ABC-type multidrug transport system ATPase subunit